MTTPLYEGRYLVEVGKKKKKKKKKMNAHNITRFAGGPPPDY